MVKIKKIKNVEDFNPIHPAPTRAHAYTPHHQNKLKVLQKYKGN
jgi:hypothetical protein